MIVGATAPWPSLRRNVRVGRGMNRYPPMSSAERYSRLFSRESTTLAGLVAYRATLSTVTERVAT